MPRHCSPLSPHSLQTLQELQSLQQLIREAAKRLNRLEALLPGSRHPALPQLQAMHVEGKPLPFFGCGATDEEPHTGPINFDTPELLVDFLEQFRKLEAAARQDGHALSDDDNATPRNSIRHAAERNLRIANHVMQMICHDWEPGLPLPGPPKPLQPLKRGRFTIQDSCALA